MAKPAAWTWTAGSLSADAQAILADFSVLYPLWEAAGPAVDVIGGNNLVLNGNATFAAGTEGQVLSIPDNTSFAKCDSSADFDLSATDFTHVIVVTLDAYAGMSNWCGLLSKGTSGSATHDFGMSRKNNTADLSTFQNGDTAIDWAGLFQTLADGTTHVLIVTHAGATIEVWLDGVSQGTGTLNAPSYNAGYPFRLGNNRADSAAAKGEYVLYGLAKRQLSNPEIVALSADPYQLIREEMEQTVDMIFNVTADVVVNVTGTA